MDYLSDTFEIKAPWTLGMNSDYDDLIWDILFEEEGIVEDPEDEYSLEDLEDELYEGELVCQA